MNVQRVQLAALHLDPNNARAHGERSLDAIKTSLQQWGQVEPLVVRSATGVVVGGNGRLAAMRALGWAEANVVMVDLDDRQAAALALTLNRSAELSGWDEAQLAKTLDELAKQDGWNPELVGFSDAEMASIVAGTASFNAPLEAQPVPVQVVEDEAPEPPKVAVCKPGELWALGEHRLLVGPCQELARHAEPGSARLMVTDPPYGVSYAAKNEFLNAVARGNRIQTPIENDHKTPDEMSVLWKAWFGGVRSLLAAGASYYVTGPQGGDLLLLLLLALRDTDYPLRHMLVWAKNQFVLGRSDYHYQHEPIIYGWLDGAGHHQVEDRGESSLWQIDKPRKSDLHPTMKPVELYARAMRNSSDRGDLVLEPFAGSGTAIVAAEQLGRRVLASEIDPLYCDVIIERWQNLTCGKAKRVSRAA